MPNFPVIQKTKVLATTKVFLIEQVDLLFSNGASRQYERLRDPRSGAVLVVPLLDDETFLLVREYAVGTERYELGFPKGLIEPDESPELAANRELMEEAGFGARKVTAVKKLAMAPGYFQHQIHMVVAEDLFPKRLQGDEPEEIEVVPWKWRDLSSLLQREDFCEARSIAALFIVKDFLRA